MTEQELKAKAYDYIAQIQYCQTELAKINEELARLAAEQNQDK